FLPMDRYIGFRHIVLFYDLCWHSWLPRLSAAMLKPNVRRTGGVLKWRPGLRSDPGQAADHRPFRVAHRADREARLAQQRHAGEFRYALHLCEADRLLDRHHRGDVDHAELAARIARVGIERPHDLDDPDDVL